MSRIELHNTDCLPYMRQCSDKQFDLAIVDPPYSELCNMHGGSSSDEEHGWGKLWATNKHHEWNKKPDPEYFKELIRVSKNQIIWGGNYFIENLKDTSCMIIWDKGQRNFSLADAEIAWSSFNKPVRIFEYSRAQNNKTDRIHVCQKPVELYKWLLHNYAKPNDKIIDTHLGSGSIALACEEYGYDLTACEIDKEYFDGAVQRLKDFRTQPRLPLL